MKQSNGPIAIQLSTSTTSKASSSSHPHQQQTTCQGQASSSSFSNFLTNEMRSNTISSEAAEEQMNQGHSSSDQISDMDGLHSLDFSPSNQHNNNTRDFKNEQPEDQGSEDMDVSVSSIKKTELKNSMDSQQSSSKRPYSCSNSPQNQESLTDIEEVQNAAIKRFKQESKSVPDCPGSSSFSKPPTKTNNPSGSSSATKVVKKNEAKQGSNNTIVLNSKLSPVNKALSNSKLPLKPSETQHDMHRLPMTIILQSSEPKFEMLKMFQSQKTRFLFENIEELSSKLETDEKGNEIRLTVLGNVLKDSTPFITKFASAISKLTLSSRALATGSPSDLQELLIMLPNLNYLYLICVPAGWKLEKKTFPYQNASSSASNGFSCLLPKVKTITCGSSDSFYPEILTGLIKLMPNLKTIFNFPLNCIFTSAAHGNLGKIKSVNVDYSIKKGMVEQLSKLEDISQKMKLTTAHFPVKLLSSEYSPDVWKSCCKSWSSIWNNNKSTIQYLKIEPFARSKCLKYPEMKAVKKLRLCTAVDTEKLSVIPSKRAGQSAKFFRENFNVRKKFPKLIEVTLESESCTFDQFCEFLPENAFPQEYFKGVTILNLEFDALWNLQELEKVNCLFPDVTKLCIKKYVQRIDFAQVFRLWLKLTSLTMRMDLCLDDDDYCLDPIFTGISTEKCRELREHKGKVDINLQSYEETFGVPDMEDLRELTLIFDYESKSCPVSNAFPRISHVAAFYGFQCLPGLKVTFAIPWNSECKDEIRKMLSPIEEYVNFNPNYSDE